MNFLLIYPIVVIDISFFLLHHAIYIFLSSVLLEKKCAGALFPPLHSTRSSKENIYNMYIYVKR